MTPGRGLTATQKLLSAFRFLNLPSSLLAPQLPERLLPHFSPYFLSFYLAPTPPPPLSQEGLINGDEGERRMGKTGTFMAELGAISPPCAWPCSTSSQN